MLFVCGVVKYFSKYKLNKANLSIKPSECFGLLSVPFGGRSHFLAVLVGKSSIDWGHIWLKGINIFKDKTSVIILYIFIQILKLFFFC